MGCPVKTKEYKELEGIYGEGRTLAAWTLNNEQIPTVEQAAQLLGITSPNTVNATLKVVEALGTGKVQKLYDKFYKSNPEKFYSELIPLAGKEQVQILKDYNSRNNPISLQDMLTGIMAEMSYTVEVNTATEKKFTPAFKRRLADIPEGEIVFDDSDYERLGIPTEEVPSKTEFLPTSHYSNLTVPGGTNYTENEIATPGITPSIKGHAQFSTDQGIGWGRWDEQISYSTVDEVVNRLKQSGRLKIVC